MKKHYIFLILFSVVFMSAIFFTREKDVENPKLKMRAGNISVSSEWVNTKKAIETLEDDLRRNPKNNEIKLKLVQAYIQEGRVTGDHNYYDALAFSLVNDVLKEDNKNFEALCCKATLQASAHQFTDALTTAREAQLINPHNAFVYGIMCDANVELGNYVEAIFAGDKMVSIRPDIRSYSRISYLREITGDYQGAIEAMKMAVDAGVPGMEQTEWARTYLGKLYEVTGKPETAISQFNLALIHRPYFAPALAGLGRIERSRKNYDEAIAHFKSAAENMQDYSFHQELALTFQLAGKKQQSASEYQIALDILMKHKHPTTEEFGIGHNIDRELALVYLAMGEYKNALNNAKAEFERRPSNIDVNEVLAWSYYKNGDSKAAFSHILRAMSTKSGNAELLYKAGIIFSDNQKPNLGKRYQANALMINPYLDTNLLLGSNPGLAINN